MIGQPYTLCSTGGSTTQVLLVGIRDRTKNNFLISKQQGCLKGLQSWPLNTVEDNLNHTLLSTLSNFKNTLSCNFFTHVSWHIYNSYITNNFHSLFMLLSSLRPMSQLELLLLHHNLLSSIREIYPCC